MSVKSYCKIYNLYECNVFDNNITNDEMGTMIFWSKEMIPGGDPNSE